MSDNLRITVVAIAMILAIVVVIGLYFYAQDYIDPSTFREQRIEQKVDEILTILKEGR